ncbi:MAG: DUF5652 family protein [Candidatus Margulisiibacteriota bacterium]|jgi:hypothetical protein
MATTIDLSSGAWVLFSVLLAWSIVWKGIALWKAARNNASAWFIVFMILNTAGILEIIYIFAIKNGECCKQEKQKLEK